MIYIYIYIIIHVWYLEQQVSFCLPCLGHGFSKRTGILSSLGLRLGTGLCGASGEGVRAFDQSHGRVLRVLGHRKYDKKHENKCGSIENMLEKCMII